MKDFTTKQKQIARYAKALAHPVRIAILEVIPVAKSTLSQHLKELKEAGLIQRTITPPTIKYCINRENWDEARGMFSQFLHDLKNDGFVC